MAPWALTMIPEPNSPPPLGELGPGAWITTNGPRMALNTPTPGAGAACRVLTAASTLPSAMAPISRLLTDGRDASSSNVATVPTTTTTTAAAIVQRSHRRPDPRPSVIVGHRSAQGRCAGRASIVQVEVWLTWLRRARVRAPFSLDPERQVDRNGQDYGEKDHGLPRREHPDSMVV